MTTIKYVHYGLLIYDHPLTFREDERQTDRHSVVIYNTTRTETKLLVYVFVISTLLRMCAVATCSHSHSYSCYGERVQVYIHIAVDEISNSRSIHKRYRSETPQKN